MSLLNDILVWATANLTEWQRDAMRRLFQKQNLDTWDIDDLYAMLKSSHRISDPKNRQPVPLAKEHIPESPTDNAPVILLGMRDLKYVNRITSGGKLEFSPKGITVIYGANASGKSGYSRVLKRACRARDLSETVHPDATDPNAARNVPQATFDIEVGGVKKEVIWKYGNTPPDELSTISVFDSRCARVYLDDEQDLAYLPYGLDIMENLGQRVFAPLARRLDEEIATLNTDTAPFSDLLGDTVVGKIIASLSKETDTQKVMNLATLTTVEKERLGELDTTLAESNPKAKAKNLRLSAQRIDGLTSRIDKAIAWVDDAVVERLKACDSMAETASRAAVVAAEKFRVGDTLLRGTGEQVWKDLFEAARRFSTEIAYPDESFPHIVADAQCPLCQQSLNDDAQKRLLRFEEFVKHDTAKDATEKYEQLAIERKKIESVIPGFGLDVAITEELKQLNEGLLQAMQDFERRVEYRRIWLLSAAKAHIFDAPPAIDGDTIAGLKALSQGIVVQADELEQAIDEKLREALEVERGELKVRVNLSPRFTAVLDLIQRMRHKDALIVCWGDLGTKAISDKAKEFASQAVTTALENALDVECKSLGVVEPIKTMFNKRTERGKTWHKLALDFHAKKELNEILSEGEQRTIAIGSFLAELHLANHSGGIVFDDPVSSLDHHRRKYVAYRLVKEAKKRQVIVLTHDTVFLCELLDEINKQAVDNRMYNLEWMKGYPGHVSEGLPWEHKSCNDRLTELERTQQALKGTWQLYPNKDERMSMRHQYDLLRATVERVIEEHIFNGVAERYIDRISFGKLAGVVGFDEAEYMELNRLHDICCDNMEGHDHPPHKDVPVRTPTQLGEDILAVRVFIKRIKDRRKLKKK